MPDNAIVLCLFRPEGNIREVIHDTVLAHGFKQGQRVIHRNRTLFFDGMAPPSDGVLFGFASAQNPDVGNFVCHGIADFLLKLSALVSMSERKTGTQFRFQISA